MPTAPPPRSLARPGELPAPTGGLGCPPAGQRGGRAPAYRVVLPEVLPLVLPPVMLPLVLPEAERLRRPCFEFDILSWLLRRPLVLPAVLPMEVPLVVP